MKGFSRYNFGMNPFQWFLTIQALFTAQSTNVAKTCKEYWLLREAQQDSRVTLVPKWLHTSPL